MVFDMTAETNCAQCEQWIVYDNYLGLEIFASEDAAIAEAEQRLSEYRAAAQTDGWSDDVHSIIVAQVTHKPVITDYVTREEAQIDEDGMDNLGQIWDSEWGCMHNMQLAKVATSEPPA